MRKVMTLEQLLRKTDDGTLLEIQEEMLAQVVPATGSAHGFIRKVNKMIDQGKLCINATTYRKVYLPTLVKAVQKEMAYRYTLVLKGQAFTEAASTDSCEQITLDLVENTKQGKIGD